MLRAILAPGSLAGIGAGAEALATTWASLTTSVHASCLVAARSPIQVTRETSGLGHGPGPSLSTTPGEVDVEVVAIDVRLEDEVGIAP